MKPIQSFLLAYVVNSIWQVPLIFFVAKGIVRLAPSCGAAMRHRVWVAALLLETALPASSFSLFSLIRQWLHITAHVAPGSSRVTTISGEGSLQGTLALPGLMLVSLAGLYLSVFLYSTASFVWSLLKVHWLRRSSRPLLLSPGAQERWNLYRSRFQVPDATLAASSDVCGPVTIGVLHKTMLLPPDFETSLAAEDQAAAFAHEFAHMQRGDFAKNLIYQVLSLFIAYHPALRGTLAHLVETREILCDELAAGAVEGPRRYAKSLLRLASIFTPARSSSMSHAIGIFDANTQANTLETRIMNLTTPNRVMGRTARVVVGALSAVILLAACTSAMALRVAVGEPARAGEPAVSGKAAKVSGAVMQGNIIKKVDPVYPPEAKEAKITGSVVLKAIIGETGVIEQLTVVSGPSELRRSALDAVRQWVYKPYLLNGNPTEVETTITVNYSLTE